MPGFAATDRIGVQPITSFWALDTVYPGGPIAQPFMPGGFFVHGDDNYWGGAEFLYVRAGATIRQFGLCQIQPTFNATLQQYEYIATEMPVTANTGRSVGVAMRAAVVNQYLWICVGGVTPIAASASVAAGTTFGATTAGLVGANSAGRQVLNAVSVAPSTTTVIRRATAPNAATILVVDQADGWFPGVTLSGTGIAGGTTVTAIDVSAKTVTLSAATNAAVNGNITATYTNFIVGHINRPTMQGATT